MRDAINNVLYFADETDDEYRARVRWCAACDEAEVLFKKLDERKADLRMADDEHRTVASDARDHARRDFYAQMRQISNLASVPEMRRFQTVIQNLAHMEAVSKYCGEACQEA